MHTGAHLVDPGGHRLVKVGRDLSGDDGVWFEAGSRNPNVSMLESDELPERTWFLCKACRDVGIDWHSWIDLDEIRGALDPLGNDTPRRVSISTHPVSAML